MEKWGEIPISFKTAPWYSPGAPAATAAPGAALSTPGFQLFQGNSLGSALGNTKQTPGNNNNNNNNNNYYYYYYYIA